MKKTSILIAAFAVIIAASAAKAQVDFDGKSFKNIDLSQAVQENSLQNPVPLPEPAMELSLNTEKHKKKTRFYDEQGNPADNIDIIKKVITNEKEIGALYKWAISSDKKIYSVGIPRSESEFKNIHLKYGDAKLIFPEHRYGAAVAGGCRFVWQAIVSGVIWDGIKWVTKYTYEKVKVCDAAEDDPNDNYIEDWLTTRGNFQQAPTFAN